MTLQVARIAATVDAVPFGTLQVSAVTASTVAQVTTLRVSSVKVSALASLSIPNAGTDQIVEPGVTVTLTGAGANGADALSYGWSQTAGPPVVLVGTGATRTFTAPASADPLSLTFALAVDTNPAQDTVNVSVLPATEFWLSGGVWQPLLTFTDW